MSKNNKGFSLIEAIISSAVLLLAGSGFLAIVGASVRFMEKEESAYKDIIEAQNMMESVRAVKIEDLQNNTYMQIDGIDLDRKIVTVKAGKISLTTMRIK